MRIWKCMKIKYSRYFQLFISRVRWHQNKYLNAIELTTAKLQINNNKKTANNSVKPFHLPIFLSAVECIFLLLLLLLWNVFEKQNWKISPKKLNAKNQWQKVIKKNANKNANTKLDSKKVKQNRKCSNEYFCQYLLGFYFIHIFGASMHFLLILFELPDVVWVT